MSVDLRTRYLGLELRSPDHRLGRAAERRSRPWPGALERAGVGAIVLPSLFEEEILAEELGLNRSLEQGTENFAEALDYFPRVDAFVGAADRYVAAIERVRAAGRRADHREPECDAATGAGCAMRGGSRTPVRTRSS